MNGYSVPLAAPVQEDDLAMDYVDHGSGALDEPAVPVQIPTPCLVPLPDGCYRFSFTPSPSQGVYRGTLRVDRAEGRLVVSGDLYFYPPVLGGTDERPRDASSALPDPVRAVPPVLRKYGIPIYPRKLYHFYLRATKVTLKSVSQGGKCFATITFEQYKYTHPPANQFDGTFPPAPGTKTVTIRFALTPPPTSPWPGNYYTGQWLEGNVSKGAITLGWVSKHFRKCTIEVDTLIDAVAPQPVPALSGPANENFGTMLASAGWSASVIYDQTQIPKPANQPNHKDCWNDGPLHGLMASVRKPTTNLDAEWRLHLLVVPARMGCSRGRMYDSIGVPREGVVSFCDDGYPSDDSSFFGAAENKMQRQVPRAFIRSASHELVHGFNQIHQEQEGGADNSIMTTTPSVADVLATATTGDPGIFPNDIKLAVNQNVRHHMIHFPDPVVRPGGHTFASWASGASVPSADRFRLGPDVATLSVAARAPQIELGEPAAISWELTNTSDQPLPAPSEVTQESLYGRITVIDSSGRRRQISPFVIECEASKITTLEPGDSRTASTRLFWAGDGFAFERPGRYTVEVSIDWTVEGRPLSVVAETPVFVNYPTSSLDNDAAARLLNPEVGKWVALGGGAPHLTEAVAALNAVRDMADAAVAADAADGVGVKALRGFEGLLPENG
jgi:hypothetical protein